MIRHNVCHRPTLQRPDVHNAPRRRISQCLGPTHAFAERTHGAAALRVIAADMHRPSKCINAELRSTHAFNDQ